MTQVGGLFAVCSRTVTWKLQELVSPKESSAPQTTLVVPIRKKLPGGGEQLRLFRPQASAAVAVYFTTVQPEFVARAVISAGQLTTGGVVSTTVTVKVQVLALPALSVALHVTLLWPARKLLPDGGVQVVVTGPPQRSNAVTV